MSKLPGWDREESRDDDWLIEEDDFDWLDDPRYDDVGRAEDSERRGAAARDRAPASGRERSAPSQSAVFMRRRRIAAVSAFALVVAAGIGVAVAMSGGGSNTPAVQPTPQPQPTPPAGVTPQPPPASPTPPATPPAPQPSVPKVTLPPNGQLAQGDNGPAVVALQKALKALGYYEGTPDGDFGPATKAAVVAFQEANGLTPDGIVGSTTAQKLNAAG